MIPTRDYQPLTQSNKQIRITIAVSELYTQEEGLKAVREALADREDTKVHTDFLVRILELIFFLKTEISQPSI